MINGKKSGILKKSLAMMLCLALVLSMLPMAFAATVPEASFKVVTQVYDYSQDSIAVVIDAGSAVKGDSIDLETFAVSAVYRNPVSNAITFNNTRTITKAYVNDAPKLAETGKAAGRYIVLELRHAYSGVPGSSTQLYTGGRNLLLNMVFTVTQKAAFTTEAGATVAVDGMTFTQAGFDNLIVDDFAYGTDVVDYRLFTPENATGKLPIIVWLHGAGEAGTNNAAQVHTNNEAQIRANMGGTGWVEAMQKGEIDWGYVLAPQYRSGWNATERAAVVNIVKKMIDEGKVDASRVYISGCSMGGGGTVNTVTDFPEFFAAAIPICPVTTLTAENAALWANGGVKSWYVHAANDPTVNVSSSRTGTANLTAAGADTYYTEFPNVVGTGGTYNGHWSWIYVLSNFTDPAEAGRGKIMNWLFAQKKAVPEAALSIPVEKIVAGYAANIPAVLTFTGAPKDVSIGLFAPDGSFLKAIDVNADGKYILSITAAQAIVGTYTLKAGNGATVLASAALTCVPAPTNLWAPVVTVLSASETKVTFAANVSFNDAKKSVTIAGAPVAGNLVSVSGNVITIAAGTANGQVIVISGVKYAELYPSYSFGFTLTN